MEPICSGWLVKSPPEQKSSGTWKIFGAKWKRRFFVLYAPPGNSGAIGNGARAAMLEYYTSKKLSTKVGYINLADCDEVLSNLDSDVYKNVFGLHTKHKGRYRTYYLVADTEDEMNAWVSNLCNVLGLLENALDENRFPCIPENKFKSASSTLPKPNFQTHPNLRKNPDSTPRSLASSSNFSSLSSRLNSSESNLLDVKLFSVVPGENERKLKSGGSVPELETSNAPCFIVSKQREGKELPPIPPQKVKKSLEDLAGGSSEIFSRGIAQMSNLMTEECLGAPPPKPPKERKKPQKVSEENYNIPKSLETANLSSRDAPNCVDPCDVNSTKFETSRSCQTGSSLATYDAVRTQGLLGSAVADYFKNPPIPAARKSVINRNFVASGNISADLEFYSVPKSDATLPDLKSNNFYNVPPNHSLGNLGQHSFDGSECRYDIPGQASEQVMGRKAEKLQKQWKENLTPDNREEAVQTYDAPRTPAYKPVPAQRSRMTSQGAYTADQPYRQPLPKPDVPAEPGRKVVPEKSPSTASEGEQVNSQTYSSPELGSHVIKAASFNKAAAAIVVQDSIRFTQRTKSFKRNIEGHRPEHGEKKLPVKRITEREASSDDYDSGGDGC